jgi:hypothetical protein
MAKAENGDFCPHLDLSIFDHLQLTADRQG